MERYLRWMEALFVSTLAVFAPIKTLAAVTLAFIVIDLITGIVAAVKQGEKITSCGIRRTLSKIFVYELALCVGFLGEHYIIQELPLIKMISGMIGCVEMKSILENLDRINGTSLLKSIIDKIGSTNDIVKP